MILIGGSQRSGTTLLQTLLCNAAGVFPILPEAHAIYDQLRSYQRAGELWKKSEDYFGSEDSMESFYRENVSRLLSFRVNELVGIERLVLKDPRFIEVIAPIRNLFPEARVVACIRDPRDVVASFLAVRTRERGRPLTRGERARIVIKSSESYRDAYRRLWEGDRGWATEVFYEELVAEPATTTERVLGRCGYECKETDFTKLLWLEADRRHQVAWTTEIEGRAPSPKQVGRFARAMSSREISQVESVCETEMDRFGYVPHGRSRAWRILRRGRRTLSGGGLRA